MPLDRCNKRTAILESALELFAENGFHGSPTSLIAERAGVGVGTIYRYFKDKEELIQELHREIRARAVAQVCDGYAPEQPVRERYIFLCTRLMRFFLSGPHLFKFMEQYYYSPFGQRCGHSAADQEEVVQNLLRYAQEQQIIKDIPMPVVEAIAFGPLINLAKEHINRRLVVNEEMIREVVQASWDGLKR